jgi:hypothetical protein
VLLAATNNTGLFDPLHQFFRSDSWLITRSLLLFFVVLFWIAVGYWVYKDAKRRLEDPWLVALSVLVGLVPPFLGAFVYMLFRPPEYLEDVRERELEVRAMEEQLGGRQGLCPVCRAEVDAAFLVCPICTTRLRQACGSCRTPLEPLWQVCPFCATAAAPAGPLGTTVPPPPLGDALEPARFLRRD